MNKKIARYSILAMLEQVRKESKNKCWDCPLESICDVYIEEKEKSICEKLEGDLRDE